MLKNPMNIVKFVALFLSCALLYAIHLANPTFFPELWQVLKSGDLLATAEYIRSFGSWAMFFSFWLVLFVSAIGFPPAIIFSTANALIFGIVPGIVLSVIAETVGVTISFLLLRFLFRASAEQLIAKHPRLKKVDAYSGKNGFTVMLIARMVPYVPSALLNALGALSAISLRDYVISSFVGKFPSTAIEAIIGHDTVLKNPDPTRLIFVCIAAVFLVIGAWYYEKRVEKKADAMQKILDEHAKMQKNKGLRQNAKS